MGFLPSLEILSALLQDIGRSKCSSSTQKSPWEENSKENITSFRVQLHCTIFVHVIHLFIQKLFFTWACVWRTEAGQDYT